MELFIKMNLLGTLIFSLYVSITAQEILPITLPDPDLKRTVSLMESLTKRASVREYKDSSISLQDLSNLLWAANGINRPEKKGRTAPSAINAQDIDIYVIMATAAYLYDPVKNKLNVVQKGDFRKDIGNQAFVETAPVNLILVSDLSRFKRGDDKTKMQWAAFDAGVVSQNISLYCASAGMGTVVRAMSDNVKMLVPLKLTNTQKIMLNHPVGYLK
jgi:nitroreductase